MTPTPPFLGLTEIGEALGGMSRQAAYSVTHAKTFPPPAAELAAGTFWWTGDVRAWAQRQGRTWTEPASPAPST